MSSSDAVCKYMRIHEDLVGRVVAALPDDEMLWDMADLFKIFGDSTRIKILYLLFEYELCVCDIAHILNMTQSAISHQLKILKTARLIKHRKDGKVVFYSLSDNHVHTIIAEGKEHIEEK